MAGTKFTIDAAADEGFYVTVAEDVTVYENYNDAVSEIQNKLSTDTESFLAKVTIEANGEDDVAVALEQVGWQQIIRDMAPKEDDGK
ncbi:hypothetical protein G9463_13880 [Haloarcula sp. JP-Z28]|uniref:hypothetical protein n=1 Tax=Haloarcula sp. JP-Z28 TaxID=2716715 RepID=UPI0014047ADA|nr:hypothetical protein [Haloarcula sp. JP-Z28]NHN64378.1 hypothetical protein [Haloarcula sp. JP-Z28]